MSEAWPKEWSCEHCGMGTRDAERECDYCGCGMCGRCTDDHDKDERCPNPMPGRIFRQCAGCGANEYITRGDDAPGIATRVVATACGWCSESDVPLVWHFDSGGRLLRRNANGQWEARR